MIRSNTTTNKSKNKTKPKGTSGGGNKTSTSTDVTRKATSKSGGQATKAAPIRPNPAIATSVSTKVQQQPSVNSDAPLFDSKKLKRSNSFFLTRKLSKIYHTLTGSKDSLNKIPENDDHHHSKFTRSASMAAIPLRRSYRNINIRESKLEQLREEEGHGHGHAPTATTDSTNDVELRDKSGVNNLATKGVANGHALHDTDMASADRSSMPSIRKNSFSLMSSLRRTFSVTPAKRKSHGSKWSASLMNLQQIDVMISYEDLSFINYDKFNTYEANLIRHMSQNDVNAKVLNRNSVPDERTLFNSGARRSLLSESSKSNGKPDDQSTADQYFANYPEVKRRNKQRRVKVATDSDRIGDNRRSYVQNRRTQQTNRNTFRWSTPCESLSAHSFATSNASLKAEPANEGICADAPATIASTSIESLFKRCISCNSLRRTQSMNDVKDEPIADAKSCVSNFSYYDLLNRKNPHSKRI